MAKLNYTGGSSWKTLVYFDAEVCDATNYPHLPETNETIYYETKVIGDVLLNIRDLSPSHTQYVQIDPRIEDNPAMWILKYGYFDNNPDIALNDEYTYDRDIVICYQGNSSDTGPLIYRKHDTLPTPNPPPATPSKPSGPTSIYAHTTYTYTTNTTDPEGDSIHYQFDWGDENRTWTGWHASGETANASHHWSSPGTYYVKVRAQDSNDAWSDWSPNHAVIINPVCAMKTKTDGYFYIPIVATDLLKVEMLFNNQNITGDQNGGISPYISIGNYPDGEVDGDDLFVVTGAFGAGEGQALWNYMADIHPDRVVDGEDLFYITINCGKSGTYTTNLAGVTITFNTGEERTPDNNGFVTIPQNATSFTVKRYGVPIGAMITFW